MTPLDIITLALKKAGVVGVGQTPEAEDTNDAFTDLNMMLGQWSRRRWLVFHLVDVAKVSTGAASYTVGPGGDFNVARPDRIESAYVRSLQQAAPNRPDYPLSVMTSMEDYAAVGLKSIVGFPRMVFLDSGFPTGTLYPWPIPTTGLYEIHLLFKADLAGFAALTDDVNLPPEYQEAIVYNLVVRLYASYPTLTPNPVTVALAKSSLNTVRNSNVQIATLKLPDDLVRGGAYNVYTDRG
jgi:hypothetical protein